MLFRVPHRRDLEYLNDFFINIITIIKSSHFNTNIKVDELGKI